MRQDEKPYHQFLILLELIILFSEFDELSREVLDALESFFLLGLIEFLLGKLVVFVYGAREGCQGGT